MSEINRAQIIEHVLQHKLIVIVRGVPSEKLLPLAEAMYSGGVRMIEVTYSSTKAVSDAETAANIQRLATHFAGRMDVGAGTVLTEEQVQRTKDAGGSFIISPDTCPAVIQKTRALGLVSMPGALTPTEIQTAHTAGADFVKLFPISSFGAGYLKAVKAPLAHVRLLAVGGVTPQNMTEFYRAGACGFGISSNVVDLKRIADNRFDEITALAKEYTDRLKML